MYVYIPALLACLAIMIKISQPLETGCDRALVILYNAELITELAWGLQLFELLWIFFNPLPGAVRI